MPICCSAIAIVLLLLVFVPGIGIRINGARRWLNFLGITSFQSVEAVKLILVVYTGELSRASSRQGGSLVLGVVQAARGLRSASSCVLLAQPDFGSADADDRGDDRHGLARRRAAAQSRRARHAVMSLRWSWAAVRARTIASSA